MVIESDNDVVKLAVKHFNNVIYSGVVTTAFPMKTRSLTFGELIRISGADLLAVKLQKQIERCESHEDKCKLMNLYHALFNDRDLWDLNDKDKEKTYVDTSNYKFIGVDSANVLGEAYGKAVTIIMAYLDGFGLNNISGSNVDLISKRLKEAKIDNVIDGDELHISDIRFDEDKVRIQFNVSYTKHFVVKPTEDEINNDERTTFVCTPICVSVTVPLLDNVLDYNYNILGPKKGESLYNVLIDDTTTVFSNTNTEVDMEKLKERVNVEALRDLIISEVNSSYEIFNQKLYALSLHSSPDNLRENCATCVKLGHSDCNPYLFNSSDKTQYDINEYVEEKFKILSDKIYVSSIEKTKDRGNEKITLVNNIIIKRTFNILAKDHARILNILSTPKYPFLKDSIVYTQIKIAEETEYIQEIINQAIQEEESKKEEETVKATETKTDEKKEEIVEVEEKKDDVDPVSFDPDTPDEYE